MNITIECLKETNTFQETPLHLAAVQERRNFVEAVLSLCEDNPGIGQLLTAKDKDSNTALHLASIHKKPGCPPLLLFLKRTKEPVKYLSLENSFGETPFSKAAASGDLDTVDEMLKDLSPTEKKALVSHEDLSKISPLHIAAQKGFVDIFNLLLKNEAEITQKGPDQKTALEIAIEEDQREVVRSIIKSSQWKKAFRMPCTPINGELNTPLRMLIRQDAELAEEFLDKCCIQESQTEDMQRRKQDVIKMNINFIDDKRSYFVLENAKQNDPEQKQFLHKDDLPEHFAGYEQHDVDIDNHPLIIMANHERVDLLQHPLCLVIVERTWSQYNFKSYLLQIGVVIVFLFALHLFALTSASSEETFEDYNKSAIDNMTNTTETIEDKEQTQSGMESLNPVFRVVLLLVIVTRAAFFFVHGEFYPLWRQVKRIEWRRINLPFTFLLGFATYSLAFFVACQSLVWGTSSSFFWQLTAATITLSWTNLLLHMRLLYGIGIYLIILREVILTFMIVFVILLSGFGFCVHMLVSHWHEFVPTHNAEEDIFLKGSLTKEWVPVPLPVIIFTAFVICITLLAFNVLIGVTLDDVRHFMGNPDVRRVSMRMELIRQMEQMAQLSWTLSDKKKLLDTTLTKKTPFERLVWKKIEKRQGEQKKMAARKEEEKRRFQEIKEQFRIQQQMIEEQFRIQQQMIEGQFRIQQQMIEGLRKNLEDTRLS